MPLKKTFRGHSRRGFILGLVGITAIQKRRGNNDKDFINLSIADISVGVP
ncbi:hypothetical protein Mal65_42890 [Crateriforma conspicua]|nr:hypothetical protein Mal65_42890 [Crateriforma conspicua]